MTAAHPSIRVAVKLKSKIPTNTNRKLTDKVSAMAGRLTRSCEASSAINM
jgi:hypothetical protein